MTLTKNSVTEILAESARLVRAHRVGYRGSLLSRCGEGKYLRSCIRLPALRASGFLSQEVRHMAKVSGTAEFSVSQQVAVGRFLFPTAQKQ